jgi:hypothetical protein
MMKFSKDLLAFAFAALLALGGSAQATVPLFNPARGAFSATVVTTDNTETPIARIQAEKGKSYVLDMQWTHGVIGGVGTFEQGGSSRHQRTLGVLDCSVLFTYLSETFSASSSSCNFDGSQICDSVTCNQPSFEVDSDGNMLLSVTGETDITYRWNVTVKARRVGGWVALLATGEPAGTNAQCQSGFAFDGFCCNTNCNGVCRACSNAKSGGPNGTCTLIPNLSDPDNECTVAHGPRFCNGAGACGLYCGDNNLDSGAPFNEQCDAGQFNPYPVTCCNNDCTFTAQGAPCTDSGGTECDGAEHCVTTSTTTSTSTTSTTTTSTTTTSTSSTTTTTL